MCGIFGILSTDKSELSLDLTGKMINVLFELSESRGKESSGMAIKNGNTKQIHVLKRSVPATELTASSEFAAYISKALKPAFDGSGKISGSLALIAHARLVTNGTQENNNNNQPVIKSGQVAVHNGIITNVDELWAKHTSVKREFEVDTEVMLALNRMQQGAGLSRENAFVAASSDLKGTFSTAILDSESDSILLATNNGSLYTSMNGKGLLVFASEKFILAELIHRLNLVAELGLSEPEWAPSRSGLVFNLQDGTQNSFSFSQKEIKTNASAKSANDEIVNHSPDVPVDFQKVNTYFEIARHSPLRKLLEYHPDAVAKLKRCSKCLLPETFPFIQYDGKGVCNYCAKYVIKNQGSKEEEFHRMMDKYRSKDGSPDCVIPFSGGRDSSYGLHYIVHELKMRPITYTYDWGMVTDLARRNIARVCGKLGIENILVSADLPMKRRNIKLNVDAWLKQPILGLIPLFMAGDKQFFHYVNEVKKQTGITMDIWSTNQLENTDFKVGFCGISPSFDKSRPDYLPLSSKISLAWFYGWNFLKNPAYLNASIKDTLASFYAYYQAPRTNFYQLFDYVKWEEQKIEKTLIEEYEWELAPDTKSTWRIGDGTAPFYNYIYYTVTGFSEFDTFRSNQIREGLITREEGLRFINEENQPRFESLKWYLDAIHVDFEKAVKTINGIPKLYQKYL